jgi:hypothetical protein
MKTLKTRSVRIILAVLTLLYGLIFYQYGLKQQVGIAGGELRDAGITSSVFLCLFGAFLGIVPSVVLGSKLGAGDISARALAVVVQGSGRLRSLTHKLVALLVVVGGSVVSVGGLGLALGGAAAGDLGGVDWSLLGRQILVVLATSYCLGLLAMTVSFALGSAMLGNVACLGVLLAGQLFPQAVAPTAQYLTPFYYVVGGMDDLFPNLSGLSFVTLTTGDWLPVGLGAWCLVAYGCVLIAGLATMWARRDIR